MRGRGGEKKNQEKKQEKKESHKGLYQRDGQTAGTMGGS